MTLTWSVPPSEARPIAAVLHGLMAATRTEPGCAGCSLSTDLGIRAVINYAEEWRTEADLKRQLRSNRFSVLAELLERASEQPSVVFALGGIKRGLDYAEEIRQSSID